MVRVYNQYIKGKPAVIMSIVPKGQTTLIARADTWQRYERTIPERDPNEAPPALRTPTDEFDRSQRPGPGAAPTITLPTIWRDKLSNGVEVLGAINDETPTTAVRLMIDVGQDAESLDKLGLASLSASMLSEATMNSTNEELSNQLAKLGSNVWVSSGDRQTTMTVRSLTENLDQTLAIAAERLLEPKLDPGDFARVKGQTIQGIEVSKTQPSTTASAIFRQFMYGADNAFAHPDAGTAQTVPGLTLDDVKAFMDTQYAAGRVSVVAVSDLPKDEMMSKLEAKFGALWDREAPADPALHPAPALNGGTLYLVNKPGAAQSEIRVGMRAMPRDFTSDFYRATLMNYALGGAFNSRINLNLREDKGYTYGARGGFRGDKEVGRYTVSAGVRTDATAASIVEMVKELEQYRAEGPTADEVAFTKASIGQRDAREYETPQQKLSFLANILEYDLPDDFVDTQQEILADVTEGELDKLAADLLKSPSDMIMVVVGDKATILPSLKELGYPIVELDTDGNPTK